MKTKAICILLFAFLFCVRVNAHACICPSEFTQNTTVTEQNFELSFDQCQDCGHTQNCCVEQQDSEISSDNTATWKFFEISVVDKQPLFASVVLIPTPSPFSVFANKSPPNLPPNTLVSLHQRLLI
ncbi:MAG: hypothetical protein IAF58_03235 [Leptolyngbya sp.]|nr:hypothetical protein [Candidatus Melainabacteria bacterium]